MTTDLRTNLENIRERISDLRAAAIASGLDDLARYDLLDVLLSLTRALTDSTISHVIERAEDEATARSDAAAASATRSTLDEIRTQAHEIMADLQGINDGMTDGQRAGLVHPVDLGRLHEITRCIGTLRHDVIGEPRPTHRLTFANGSPVRNS